MVANSAFVSQQFDRFNHEIFGGQLPPIAIRISHAKGFVGKLCYRTERSWLLGRVRKSDFVLRINDRIDLPQDELEDTIIHEMIHYYIALNDIPDRSSHGPEFRRMMTHINRTFGRHISISHRTTAEQQRALHEDIKPRIVAVIHLSDGRTCIKRIPLTGCRWGDMDRQLRAAFPIQQIEWYYTTLPYFGRFPASTAMKMQIIPSAEIEALLSQHDHSYRTQRLNG